MERLTSWNDDCVQINGHGLHDVTRPELVQMADRLARYTAYQYYDENGTFVGCSDESCLDDLLEKANVEVRDG